MQQQVSRQDALSLRRNLSLMACFLSGLGCGTMYLYSAYAPQIASRLSLTATTSSYIGMVGNLGMALTGPIAGSVVDKHGPTLPVIIGGIATFSGYSIVKRCYEYEIPNVPMLAGSLLVVGIGSTFAFSAVVKCAALNFPNIRGFATSLPMAAFGLTAFIISTLATIYVPGNTLGFLKILVYLPATLFALCVYFIRFMPPKGHSHAYQPTPSTESRESIELHTRRPSDLSRGEGEDVNHDINNKPHQMGDIRGMQLLKTRLFWAHFLVMGIIAGVGQMYIYSCGYCVKALAAADSSIQNGVVDEKVVQQVQSVQVGLISLSSFGGRLISGSLSDLFYHRYKLQRTWLLVGAGLISCLTQFVGLTVEDTGHLWMVSIGTGLAYGICYGSYPTIVGDSFGMKNFSQNWGLLSLSPICASYLFNMLFGYYYDKNSIPDSKGHQMCVAGRACYSSAFQKTLLAALFVVFLALELINGQRRRTVDHRGGH